MVTSPTKVIKKFGHSRSPSSSSNNANSMAGEKVAPHNKSKSTTSNSSETRRTNGGNGNGNQAYGGKSGFVPPLPSSSSLNNSNNNNNSNSPGAHRRMSSMELAKQYDVDRKNIIKSCFSKVDHDGALHESYITHVRIIEDAHYPSSRPPVSSSPSNKKQRILMIAVKKSGRVRLHKGREGKDGAVQIGRTWDLDELTKMEKDEQVPTGFMMHLGKQYYWETNDPKEVVVFNRSIVDTYMKYTHGKCPELVNWDPRVLGISSAIAETSSKRSVPGSSVNKVHTNTSATPTPTVIATETSSSIPLSSRTATSTNSELSIPKTRTKSQDTASQRIPQSANDSYKSVESRQAPLRQQMPPTPMYPQTNNSFSSSEKIPAVKPIPFPGSTTQSVEQQPYGYNSANQEQTMPYQSSKTKKQLSNDRVAKVPQSNVSLNNGAAISNTSVERLVSSKSPVEDVNFLSFSRKSYQEVEEETVRGDNDFNGSFRNHDRQRAEDQEEDVTALDDLYDDYTEQTPDVEEVLAPVTNYTNSGAANASHNAYQQKERKQELTTDTFPSSIEEKLAHNLDELDFNELPESTGFKVQVAVNRSNQNQFPATNQPTRDRWNQSQAKSREEQIPQKELKKSNYAKDKNFNQKAQVSKKQAQNPNQELGESLADRFIDQLFQEINWKDSDDVTTIEQKLLKELNKINNEKCEELISISNNNSILEQSLDNCLKECDRLDPIFAFYNVELTSFQDEVNQISGETEAIGLIN
ncbi:hypothetical protein PACTADRAFT_49500, partial [Pachysolen tannophilus NRRL Y-2460]